MRFDLVLRNGTLVDGTGAPARRGDVGIVGDRIETTDDLRAATGRREIDATGMVVAPGFIDQHQHGDITPLVDGRCASALGQGITTIVVGNCGHGIAPGADPHLATLALIGFRAAWGVSPKFATYRDYAEALLASRPAVHVGMLAAHGAIRLATLGPDDRHPTGDELRAMGDTVEQAMEAGALGVSSGLEYSPGEYADQAELTRLAEAAGRGSVYASHIRNRTTRFVAAVEEAISVAEMSGVRLALSHLAPRPNTPVEITERVHDVIGTARSRGVSITLDTFPDPYGPGALTACLPHAVVEGSPDEILAGLADPSVQRSVADAFDRRENFLFQAVGPETARLTASKAHPDLLGRSLAEIADAWGVHMGVAACRILVDEGRDFPNVVINHPFATPEELDRLIRDPTCAFESDGIVACPDGVLADMTMNRSTYGYTARVLGEHVRDRGTIGIEEAIRRMTSLPADTMGLRDRGRLVPGRLADLVVFDPSIVADRTTDLVLAEHPAGFREVIVAGEIAWRDGRQTEARAGRLARPAAS